MVMILETRTYSQLNVFDMPAEQFAFKVLQ